MLSSILKSDRAIQVNIQIMKAFTQMRQMLSTHEKLREKIEAMERGMTTVENNRRPSTFRRRGTRGDRIRIISARLATNKERFRYKENEE
jgi:uncharacterized DUF497 family protein